MAEVKECVELYLLHGVVLGLKKKKGKVFFLCKEPKLYFLLNFISNFKFCCGYGLAGYVSRMEEMRNA